MIIVSFKPGEIRRSNDLASDPYLNNGLIHWRVSMRPHLWRPATDLFELEDRYIVRVEVAGMNEKDFSISMDQNVLTIRGARPDSSERRAFHQMEIQYGEFITQVEIPNNIERDRVEAEYQDGFLRVILPKAQPKQIRINRE